MRHHMIGRAMFRCALVLGVPVLLLAGCQRYQYEVEMTPVGDKVERRVELRHSERNLGSKDKPVIDRIAKLYGADSPRVPGKTVSFQEQFAGRMPADVGGAGNYSRWDTPLGSVVVYVERFRGNDDLFDQLELRRKSVDELANLVLGWLESELKDEPGWPALREFLDTQARRDLQNLSICSWSVSSPPGGHAPESGAAMTELGVRAVHYLTERGYVAYDEVPALWRAISDLERGNPEGVLSKVRAILLAKMPQAPDGTPAAKPALLTDSSRMLKSWNAYLERAEILADRKARLRDEREAELAKTREELRDYPKELAEAEQAITKRYQALHEDALAELYGSAMVPWFANPFSDHDKLQVSIKTPRKPVWTNGQWNDAEQKVVWSGRSLASGSLTHQPTGWPVFCFAVWDEPNDEAQARLFGASTLRGERLLEYALWHGGLTSQEQQEWNAFAATLGPDAASKERLRAFRFFGEPAQVEAEKRLVHDAANCFTTAWDEAPR